MTEQAAPLPAPRRGVGWTGLTLLALLFVFIAANEYNWLITPWWQKTIRWCGSFGISDMLDELRSWQPW
ncbi:MAG TPA: hypothetical protein VGC56_07105 [Allosphingosinicella sp.]